MSGFNVIMMRTYFTTNIPVEVIEAAKIDGSSELKLLLKVVLPMSLPIIATVGLLVGLGYWNDWLNGLYYVNDDRLYSIQVLLNKMLLNAEAMKKAPVPVLWRSFAFNRNEDGGGGVGGTAGSCYVSVFSEIFCQRYYSRRR